MKNGHQSIDHLTIFFKDSAMEIIFVGMEELMLSLDIHQIFHLDYVARFLKSELEALEYISKDTAKPPETKPAEATPETPAADYSLDNVKNKIDERIAKVDAKVLDNLDPYIHSAGAKVRNILDKVKRTLAAYPF
jgi:hypothetical protein